MKEKLGLFRGSQTSDTVTISEKLPDLETFEFPVSEGVERDYKFTPWSSIAYLDREKNRFIDARTLAPLTGREYRRLQQEWRDTFITDLITSRFPLLDDFEVQRIVYEIDQIRNSDLGWEEKNDRIGKLIGSP